MTMPRLTRLTLIVTALCLSGCGLLTVSPVRPPPIVVVPPATFVGQLTVVSAGDRQDIPKLMATLLLAPGQPPVPYVYRDHRLLFTIPTSYLGLAREVRVEAEGFVAVTRVLDPLTSEMGDLELQRIPPIVVVPPVVMPPVVVVVPPADPAGHPTDLAGVAVYNSPSDIAQWPITTTITRLVLAPGADGMQFTFSGQQTWPDYMPPGWGGGIVQYTMWVVVQSEPAWATSGFTQMWTGRPWTGAPLLSNWQAAYVYSDRWGSLARHTLHAREVVGFFLSAGNARGVGSVTSVRERSNVVWIALPATETGVYEYGAGK